MKLNVLLAKTELLSKHFTGMVKDYCSYFSKNQGDFKGVRATYEAAEGMVDDPSKRGFNQVVTTVDEKFEYFQSSSKEYINALFSQEATNASGNAKAPLMVEGEEWGVFSSLELLRLKSLVENKELERMFLSIPVRSDALDWKESSDETYKDRKGIYELPKVEGEAKTTVKESYILPDPNISKIKDSANYTPQVAVKNNTVTVGTYTQQGFSGEYSHKQRASILRRRTILLTAITEALKVCNEVEAVESGITSDKIFNYLLAK